MWYKCEGFLSTFRSGILLILTLLNDLLKRVEDVGDFSLNTFCCASSEEASIPKKFKRGSLQHAVACSVPRWSE